MARKNIAKKKNYVNKFKVKCKLRRNDSVIVIAGKEKGKKGKIERIDLKKQVVIIPGINLVKKHKRSQDQQKKPEIVEIAAPIPISNVMLEDPKTKKPTRIGYKIENGKKVRFAKKSNTILKDKKATGSKEKKESTSKEKVVAKETETTD